MNRFSGDNFELLPGDGSVVWGNVTIKPGEDGDKSAREALHWLIALQEEPEDRALQARFRAWRVSNPNNERAWVEAAGVWEVLGDVPAERAAHSDSMPCAENVAPEVAGAQVWRLRRHHVAGVSAVLGLLCLLFIFLPGVNIWLRADYSTGIAELREVQLEDGTRVQLGANSAIDVAYTPDRRRVHLLAGEAFFEVMPDPARPFKVVAGDVEAVVLGTAFDVRLMSKGVSVGVEHGSVAMSYPERQQNIGTPLRAGDWVRVSWDGDVERGEAAPALMGAWRAGNLIVRDEAVGSVVDALRRYYPGVIMMMDPELSAQHITGVYKLDDPVSALQAVAAAHGAIARQFGSGMVVISRF